ncbi:MAG: substrate-binding domain-containing protein [Kiritimatiellae bacterium]|nr:substrate-binding domain-containing protein [Kiritimatiellia bacterium]
MDIILFFQATTRKSWRQKLSGVHLFARKNNWLIQVIERYESGADIQQALKHWNPVGCLVDRSMDIDPPPDRYFTGIPTVYLDQCPDHPSRKHPVLLHDSAAEAALAGNDLLKMGCNSYAYLGMARKLFWDEERFDQFEKDALALGHRIRKLSRTNLIRSIKALPKPCGILAANDQCAVEAFNAAVAAGFSIPDEVAIAGIDNDEMYCESVSPGITSAEPDFEGAGYRLANMLAEEIDRIRNGVPPPIPPRTEHYGPLRLVRRGSTISVQGISPRVSRAIEFIRCHACSCDLKIDDVASAMNCSRRLATLLFRKETGTSILEAIQDRRFERICELLKHTSLPISTVIEQSGYSSCSFVKRQFLKRTGMTMRSYRQRHS